MIRPDLRHLCGGCSNEDYCGPCECPDAWFHLGSYPYWAKKSPGTRRPNGKWYRPRKGLYSECFFDRSDETEYVSVMRTHNRDLAWWWLHQVRIVIANSSGWSVPMVNWSPEGDPGMLEFDHLDWLRTVPYDPWGEYDWCTLTDERRGVPAVVYRINTELPAMRPDYHSGGLGDRLELTR